MSALAMPIADTDALRDAFQVEARLLGDLGEVLGSQRQGVAADDIEAVDDSVYAAHRILRTLEEARRRRRSLLALLAGAEDARLSELEHALDSADPELLAARDALSDAARALSRDVDLNRRVLRRAIGSGEAQMRVLCGVEPSTPAIYTDTAAPAGARTAGLLVNRRV